MQQEIQLNIIPFRALDEEAEFAFYSEKHNCYCPIHKNDLNGAIEGLVYEKKSALINLLIEKCFSSVECIGKVTTN